MNKLNLIGLVAVFIFSISSLSMAEEQLTWLDCLHQASQNHPDLVSAQEQIQQSKASKTIAASTLWPQADTSLSLTQVKSQSTATTYAYGLSGSQLLFDGFKSINNVHSSFENVKASKENFHYVSSQVRLRLRTAFIGLLKAQELIKLTKEIYDIRKQNLDLISLRYKAGTEHRGALLTAQANLAQAEFEIHQADRNLRAVERNLLKEIGSKKVEKLQVQGNFDISHQYKEEPDFESLVEDNPLLLRLIAKKNAASFDMKASQGNFWPSVALTGGVGKSDGQWPPQSTNTNVGLELAWPLLEGGSRLAQLAQSKSVVRDLTAQQQSLKDTLAVALEENWVSLQDAIEQVDVQQKFLEATQERAKIAQQQYSVGLITFDNWTIIEDSLVNSKKTYLNAQASALLAEANWIEAQGRTLEYANE